jgi:SAM-dependent methyltransferase
MNETIKNSQIVGLMDFQKAEVALQAGYQAGAAQYRIHDEIEITTPSHRRIGGILTEITNSFRRPISVLDVGCGTGRYFYCLQNVDRLVGMDITSEMLIAAEEPVNAEKVTARNIQLIRANAFFASFEPHSFDFIYSLGMFGHGCPVTVEVLDKFYKWLAPGGHLFFDVVDVAGLPWRARFKKKARRFVYSLSPKPVQRALDEREEGVPFTGLSSEELHDIVRKSRFQKFTISSHLSETPLWQGRHLECWAVVPPDSNSSSNTPTT